MGNSVRFVIAKEETLASGLELRLQALGALCERFYYSEKGMEKASVMTRTSEGGREAPLTSLGGA